MTNIDYRKRQAKLMDATVADEHAHADWDYEAIRPLEHPPRPWHSGMKVTSDCSKGVQFIDWWSENPNDPMGMGYGPYGNSATLWMHLQHLDHPSELKVGDIVTFGVRGSEHAAKVREAGDDPLLWSDGHKGAPNFYRLSQDPRPAQFLRNRLPKYVMTRHERLLARTGWFAWMQWLNGTGDWDGYGKKNRDVRPNVPKRIPARWWVRRAQHHLHRNKGNKESAATPRG